MIGKSLLEYIEIRLCIAGFLLVAPASLAYLVASAFKRRFLLSPIVGALAILEVSFYFLVYLPRKTILQKSPKHAPPPLNQLERKALFERCSKYISGDSYPTGWFLSPDIKRENAVDWILWALFSTDSGQASEEWEEELDGYIHRIEELLGRKLEDGRNTKTRCMRLSFDPVVMTHRPLLWYLIVFGVDAYTSLSFVSLGFRHYATPKWFQTFPPRPLGLFSRSSADSNLPYWYRPHRSNTIA